jgi:hypothetical protein
MKFPFANPEKATDKKLADAVASRDAIAKRLAEAQGAVVERGEALQRLARESATDPALAAGEASLQEAQRRVATWLPTLAEKEQIVAKLESELAAAAEKKLRRETSIAIEALADEVEQAGELFSAGAVALAEAVKRAAAVIMDARSLQNYTETVVLEVPPSVEQTATLLRTQAVHVLHALNNTPAEMPTPNKPVIAPVQDAKPVTVRVFSMQQVRWTGPKGHRFAPKYTVLDLPPDVADRALALKACTPVPGNEWATYKETYVPFSHHQPAINLDGDAVEGETKPTGPLYGEVPQPAAFGRYGEHATQEFVETIGVPRLMVIGGKS